MAPSKESQLAQGSRGGDTSAQPPPFIPDVPFLTFSALSGGNAVALDTSSLRTIDDTFPPIKDKIVTFIRIGGRQVTQAYIVTDKREMLSSLKPDDILIALWTGQWRTDAFQVSKDVRARWKKELLGIPGR